MAFTIGSGTFTNGSATVTGVTLTSGTLAYFASGTRMVVGVNPVIQEVEAIAAPTVSTITLRSAWTGTGGTYSFLANQTSEGLRDAVQAIRTNNASLQSFIDSIDTAATADSVAQRDASGQLIATNLITADKIIHDGDTNTAIRFPAADTVTVETNGAERLRVDSSGRVGINTNNPDVNLSVQNTIGIKRASDGATVGSLVGNTGNFSINAGAGTMIFTAAGTERMRIAGPNVGINTSSPSSALEVNGTITVPANSDGIVTAAFNFGGRGLQAQNTSAVGTTPVIINSSSSFNVGGLALVRGRLTTNPTGVVFLDLVLHRAISGVTVIESGTVNGSPAARTYSSLGAGARNLRVAMGSDEYDIELIFLT